MSQFKIKDSVVVNQDVNDPDFGICIGGWQGRISKIDVQANIICIEWDSITLRQMPSEVIIQCEEKDLAWQRMHLKLNEVHITQPRDTEEDVQEIIEYLNEKYFWHSFGEEGKRISEVLSRKDDDDELSALEAWEEYLGEVLNFPFKALISEYQEKGVLQKDDQVKVWGVEGFEDLYGIIMRVYLGRHKYAFPLFELEPTDKSSTNYQAIEDYKTWFANH